MDNRELYLIQNRKMFSAVDAEIIRQRLHKLDDSVIQHLTFVELRDPNTIIIVSLIAGVWGVDRFLIGQTAIGIAKFLTFGGCLIWAFIDLFLIIDATRKTNMEKVLPYLADNSSSTVSSELR